MTSTQAASWAKVRLPWLAIIVALLAVAVMAFGAGANAEADVAAAIGGLEALGASIGAVLGVAVGSVVIPFVVLYFVALRKRLEPSGVFGVAVIMLVVSAAAAFTGQVANAGADPRDPGTELANLDREIKAIVERRRRTLQAQLQDLKLETLLDAENLDTHEKRRAALTRVEAWRQQVRDVVDLQHQVRSEFIALLDKYELPPSARTAALDGYSAAFTKATPNLQQMSELSLRSADQTAEAINILDRHPSSWVIEEGEIAFLDETVMSQYNTIMEQNIRLQADIERLRASPTADKRMQP